MWNSIGFILVIIVASVYGGLLRNEGDSASNYASQIAMKSLSITGDSVTDAVLSLVNSETTKYGLIFHADTEEFSIENNHAEVLSVSKDTVTLSAKSSHFSNVIFESALAVGGVQQWRMVAAENFWNEPTGWNTNQISKCGGLFMLGGYGITASEKLEKTFTDLPKDHHTVRVTGSFHFIDAWSGETAYVKVLDVEQNVFEYVWTLTYDLAKTKNGINVCGSDYPEAQLSVNFDVSVPHTTESLSIVFGTTLENDPYENSYGISNLKIYVR